MEQSPDVVLLAADRLTRAPLRAQLIEEGLEVIATDTWTMMRSHLGPGVKPRVAVVDLQGLPDPRTVLEGLRVLMKPERVLVITAAGILRANDPLLAGFRIVPRPASIAEVVRAVFGALHPQSDERR